MVSEMPVTIHIPRELREYTDEWRDIDINARSIHEAVDMLNAKFPGIKDALCDEHGDIRRSFNIFINGEKIWSQHVRNVRLRDSDRVFILPSIAREAIPRDRKPSSPGLISSPEVGTYPSLRDRLSSGMGLQITLVMSLAIYVLLIMITASSSRITSLILGTIAGLGISLPITIWRADRLVRVEGFQFRARSHDSRTKYDVGQRDIFFEALNKKTGALSDAPGNLRLIVRAKGTQALPQH